MEESNEVQTDEDKAPAEINKKRKLKTPLQVEALEKFYEEHKYPSELMKLELSEKIGLTEKQVSGWFCHRRLKDKRLMREEATGNGRLDRSSGVIQDHCSGLGQDSCGSTKPGDCKHVDLREVESRRFVSQDFLAADHEIREHDTGNTGDTDDTSSESSSALQGIFFPQSENRFNIKASRFSAQNGAVLPTTGAEDMGPLRRPSGYLKVKGKIEHAAITVVKRQLGRHYQEDGPLLGIDFDPLPPGAFEEPQPYPISGPILSPEPDLSRCKQHEFGNSYNSHNPKMSLQSSNIEHENFRNTRRPGWEIYPHLQHKQRSFLPNRNRNSPSHDAFNNMDEVYAGETSIYNGDAGQMTMHVVKGTRLHPDRDDHHYGKKIRSEQMEPYFNSSADKLPKIPRTRELLKTELLTPCPKLGESRGMHKRKLFRRTPEDDRPHGGGNDIRGYSYPNRVKMHQEDELALAKRAQDERAHPTYWRKPSIAGKPSRSNRIKGSAGEIPSSFSEDETAETSVSME